MSPQVPDSPQTFLLKPGLFPLGGRIHLLGGAPHAGKSTLLAQILRATTSGEPLFGLEAERIPAEQCAVIFTDRAWRDNSAWLKATDLLHLPHYSFADDPDVRKIHSLKPGVGQGVEMFKACLERLPKEVRLVAVDVFTTYFVGGNIFQAHSVATHMTLLQRVLIERDITLLGLVYGLKQKANEGERYVVPTERIIGAAPLRGSASTIAYLSTQEESGSKGFQELWIQSRQYASQHLYIQRNKTSNLFELVPSDIWEEAPTDWTVTQIDVQTLHAISSYAEVYEEIEDPDEEVLDPGWIPAAPIRQNLRLNRSTFSERLKRLKQLGLIETRKKGRLLLIRILKGLSKQ